MAVRTGRPADARGPRETAPPVMWQPREGRPTEADPPPTETAGMAEAQLPPFGAVAGLGAVKERWDCDLIEVDGRRRRTMRPRQLAAVISVAFSLGLVLNAGSLEHSAETSPYGLRRSAALAVLRPVAAVSHALGLDRPRAALDQALGHNGSGDGASVAVDSVPPEEASSGGLVPADPAETGTGLRDRPVTGAVPPSRPPAPPGAAPGRPQRPVQRFRTVTSARVATAADPLRVWVGGDSVAGYLGLGVVEHAQQSGVMAVHSHYQVSTGLSRPDYYDWPAHLEEDMGRFDPEVVIFLVGANDDQPLTAPDGSVADFGSTAWRQEYARRVGTVMDRLLAEHRMVVWVGQPVERTPEFDGHMRLIADIDQEQAGLRPGVVFVNSRPVFADPGGGFTAYLRNHDGGLTLMRAGDGIHLSPDGGRLLAGVILDRVEQALHQGDREDPLQPGPR